jgi:cob(I)alamin adenosyltransferase
MIQIYTGNGKGKTTASLGLALRASGAGMKVFIGQFIKGSDYSELKSLKKIKNIKLEQFGRGIFIKGIPKQQDLKLAASGLEKIRIAAASGKFHMFILDEINVALDLKLLNTKKVLELLKTIPNTVEVVLTGRNAPKEILKAADLISDIKEVKHYFHKGKLARRGIEY